MTAQPGGGDPGRYDPESWQEKIAVHQQIMAGAGFPLTGQVALVAEDQEALPGSYQVWLQIKSTTSDLQGADEFVTWVWVSPDGVVVDCDCPLGDA